MRPRYITLPSPSLPEMLVDAREEEGVAQDLASQAFPSPLVTPLLTKFLLLRISCAMGLRRGRAMQARRAFASLIRPRLVCLLCESRHASLARCATARANGFIQARIRITAGLRHHSCLPGSLYSLYLNGSLPLIRDSTSLASGPSCEARRNSIEVTTRARAASAHCIAFAFALKQVSQRTPLPPASHQPPGCEAAKLRSR